MKSKSKIEIIDEVFRDAKINPNKQKDLQLMIELCDICMTRFAAQEVNKTWHSIDEKPEFERLVLIRANNGDIGVSKLNGVFNTGDLAWATNKIESSFNPITHWQYISFNQ